MQKPKALSSPVTGSWVRCQLATGPHNSSSFRMVSSSTPVGILPTYMRMGRGGCGGTITAGAGAAVGTPAALVELAAPSFASGLLEASVVEGVVATALGATPGMWGAPSVGVVSSAPAAAALAAAAGPTTPTAGAIGTGAYGAGIMPYGGIIIMPGAPYGAVGVVPGAPGIGIPMGIGIGIPIGMPIGMPIGIPYGGGAPTPAGGAPGRTPGVAAAAIIGG